MSIGAPMLCGCNIRVGVSTLDLVADEPLDRGNDPCDRVAVVGIPGQRLNMDCKLSALLGLSVSGTSPG
jgi:hypothetical protein